MINLFFYREVVPVLLSDGSLMEKIRAFVKHRFIPIHTGGYWDVPDSFLTEHRSNVYLFTRYGFDEELDDYPPDYEVYIVKDRSLKEAVEKNLWFPFNYENKDFIGEIPTRDVIFDTTNRKFVNTVVFEMIK